MSYNRLGTLSAGLFGLCWLVAIAINLGFWLPQMLAMPPGSTENSVLFLTFVRQNALTWRLFHVGTTMGLMALIFLIPLLAWLNRGDPRQPAFTTIGVVGAFCGLLASLIDQFGTPVLARYAAGNPIVAQQIWEYVEPWRDAGLKTVSFWFLGFWVLWMASAWLSRKDGRSLGRFSQVLGWGLLILAFVETMIPPPLVYTVGETGVAGLVLLLLPVWGFWTARWFWQQEVAQVSGGHGAPDAGRPTK